MTAMRIHCLQHVPFEGPAAIEDWAVSRGHAISGTELYRGLRGTHGAPQQPDVRAVLPTLQEFELLVIMGGPMSIHDTQEYPWLVAEKALIRAAIEGSAAILGVCLGAQLVAEALGGQVTKNPHPEIGWYPVTLAPDGRRDSAFAGFSESFPALHWHGETFSIPQEAVHVASSEACPNQAFMYDRGRVIGLQFHLECTPESLSMLADAAAHELDSAGTEQWVASREELLSPKAPYTACRELLFTLLDRMASRIA